MARLRIGSNLLQGPSAGLRLGSVSLLKVAAGADEFDTWQLSGMLTYGDSHLVRFRENEIEVCRSNWDVELVGQLLTIRTAHRQIALQLSLRPNEIGVERLALKWPSGVEVTVDSQGDIIFDRLMHTEFGNLASNIRFSNTRVTSTNPISRPTPVTGNVPRNSVLHSIQFNDCMAECSGVADMLTMINLRPFLSEDMLALPS